MASFKLSFTAVLLCVAFSCCRGQGQGGGGGGAGGGAAGAGGGGGSGIGAVVPGTQDSVQIVAQAALCFDNKPVLNGCLQAMGVNARGGISSGTGMLAPGAPAIMCSPPCLGHVTMMMSCVNSIFGNFVSYNPGLMQGVQAIFQMSCGNPNVPGGPGGAAGGGGGAGGANGGVGGGAAGGGAGGIPNSMPGGGGGAGGGVGSGAAGGGAGSIPNSIPGGGGGAGGASTGIVGGAAGGGAGGIPNSIGGAPGGGAGGIPNSIGGAAAGAGGAAAGGGAVSSVGGAAGGGGTVSSVGQAAGGGGGGGAGNDTTIAGDIGTVSSSSNNSTNVVPLPPNADSHVAVSNQSQPTSSADGPTFSLKGACSCVLLVTWAGAWLVLV
ncbi:unnamed protein product [Alopecurus aequalis]